MKMMTQTRVSEFHDYATCYGDHDENTPIGAFPKNGLGGPLTHQQRGAMVAYKKVLGLLPGDYPTASLASVFDVMRPRDAAFGLGDCVQKKGAALWRGKVVGFYRPANGVLGYCIESMFEQGSVQIYPETAVIAMSLSESAS